MQTWFDKSYYMPIQKYRGKAENIKYPCYASLKLDGELEYLIVKNSKAITVNKPKYGRIRKDYPVTQKAEKLPDGIYLGELYWGEGRTVRDFHTFLAHKADDNLKLAIWGVLQYKNHNPNTEETFQILESLRDKIEEPLSIIPYWYIENQEQLEKLAEEVLSEGWEGLVVRNLGVTYQDGQSVNWIKIKKKAREFDNKNKNQKANNLKLEKYGVWI